MGIVKIRRESQSDHWLLLLHQLPAKPAYIRVKVWRRLQTLGAVAVKNAVHALPANEQSQEDFAWLRKEIIGGGGDAVVCEACLIDGLTDAEVRETFNIARDADYQEIANELRVLAVGVSVSADARAIARGPFIRLTTRHAAVVAIDFFGANGRQIVDGLLAGLQAALKEEVMSEPTGANPPPTHPENLKGHIWVTRQGVHIDRIACAWLIHRFIDPEARFRFVPAKSHIPAPGELRFDMFEAEFSHAGDRCSFEVLLGPAGLTGDRALRAIAEIVHDIDLKDTKYGREEVAGIARLIVGIASPDTGDEQRIERGRVVFDGLYDSFSRKLRGIAR